MSSLFARATRAPVLSLAGPLLVSVASLLPSLATAADRLPLVQAQQIAIQRSRQIVAQDDAIRAARELAVSAGQLPDPVLKAGIDNLPVSGADRGSLTKDFMTMRRIGVVQEITRSDKRVLRAERFEREADRNKAALDMLIASVERDTALAWLERYYAEAEAAVIAEQGKQARLALQAVESAYRAGRSSQAEVLASRSAVAQLDDRAADAARRVNNATTMLARWVGAAAVEPLAGQPSMDSIRLDPAALEHQLAHHPEIAVLLRQEEIAATDARLAAANRKADWTVEVAYEQRGPAYSNMVSVGVSVPLQWDRANRQDRQLAAKLAQADQAKAEREEMLRAHVAETQAMIAEWQSDRQRVSRYDRELIPLTQERTQAVLAAYRGGKGLLADVLAARRNELDTALAKLELEAATARLWARLNFLFPTSHNAPAAETSHAGESQ
jgi:outer membrane protein TolC